VRKKKTKKQAVAEKHIRILNATLAGEVPEDAGLDENEDEDEDEGKDKKDKKSKKSSEPSPEKSDLDRPVSAKLAAPVGHVIAIPATGAGLPRSQSEPLGADATDLLGTAKSIISATNQKATIELPPEKAVRITMALTFAANRT
jgi:hypothetical protein